MTLQQIIYFIEIAHTQHFTQAAQNLFVSQSALSYSIQALEKELGVPLFIRRKRERKVEMTAYGKTFLPYCEMALDKINEGQKQIDMLKNPFSGVVSILYSYINCHELIPQLFKDFYKNGESEEILIHFDVNHEKAKFEEDLLDGKADLAFACTSEYVGLDTVPVAQQELFIYLSNSHALAGREKLSLYDIKDEQIIGYYKNSNLYDWITEMFQDCGLKPNMTSSYQEWASHMVYVSLDQGIAILPNLPYDSTTIAKIKIDHPKSKRFIYMLSPQDGRLTSAAEYIRNYCMEWAKQNKDKIY